MRASKSSAYPDATRGMLVVQVIRTDRKSAVLSPSNLACLARIPTVNLTAGCAHGCLYCYTRGYSSYPGQDRIVLYANTLAKLRAELSTRRKRPAAVYFSPSSDVFQPVPEVLDLAYEILRFLLNERVGVAFLTKGKIPERHMELLAAGATGVHAGIGLITLDEALSRKFEPRAASPAVRLAQAKALVEAGAGTVIRMDPILPGLTDDMASTKALCEAVADIGAKEIAASVLFLRPAVVESLKRRLDTGTLRRLLTSFDSSVRLGIHAERSAVTATSAERRSRIYSRLEETAGEYGITVRLCACKNPDIAAGSCGIAGQWPDSTGPTQQRLF